MTSKMGRTSEITATLVVISVMNETNMVMMRATAHMGISFKVDI